MSFSPSSAVILFHGTTIENAKRIIEEGFRVSTYCNETPCKNATMYPSCTTCTCCMFGECVGFADYDKAVGCAKRTSQRYGRRGEGAVLRCSVNLGKMKTMKKVECECGCKMPFVDHAGTWIEEGYDSCYCPPDSLPALRRQEWGVADPRRITIVEYHACS